MNNSDDLLTYFENYLAESLALLRKLVEIESHSADKPGVDRLADFLASEFRAIGMEAQILPHSERGNALEVLWPSGRERSPVLILGHLDTVWPRGTLRARPFRIDHGRAYGPGIFDMKSGILLSLLLGKALNQKRITPCRDVRFFFCADEEIGSETGLQHLRRNAEGCRAVFCLEPPLPGGKVKTFRKGVGVFHLHVQGISAHAGVDHDKGVSAILELSRLVVNLHGMTDYARGITVNVGTFHGGTASNVIPSEADAEVDLRYSSVADGLEMEKRILNLRPLDSRSTLIIRGGLNRPPLERTEAGAELYEKAKTVASKMHMDLGEGSTGGGSDGSYTSAMGVPTLDGLGVSGDGAHSLDEYVEIADIPRRGALLCLLIADMDN